VTSCPELSALEIDPTRSVRDHLAACSSCRIVVELLDERRRGLDVRDRQTECARFEMLIAAREEGTLGGTAGELLAAHLRHPHFEQSHSPPKRGLPPCILRRAQNYRLRVRALCG
jgi:hypothetical protein